MGWLNLVTHVPGILNAGADLLSRGVPLYGEWTLHPVVVEQTWARNRRATVDLFASRGNTQCVLFYSLRSADALPGIDTLVHVWLHELLPVSRLLVPPWVLAVVLGGLKGPPFEPLQGAVLKLVSLKTVLLLALASTK